MKGSVSEVDASVDEAADDELALMKISDQDNASSADAEDQTDTTDPNNDPDFWKPHPLPEDCPICMVPLQHNRKVQYWGCCGMAICHACTAENNRALIITNRRREEENMPPVEQSCAFCRAPTHEATCTKFIMKRVDKGDALAMLLLSKELYQVYEQEGDLAKNEARRAAELLEKAADVGCAEAKRVLGSSLLTGKYGLVEDTERAQGLLIDAVKMGDVDARYFIGAGYSHSQEHAVAIMHWKLAAAAGHEPSMTSLQDYFSLGHLSKVDLEESLTAYQKACEEMNSEERRRVIASEEAQAGNDEDLKLIYWAYYNGIIDGMNLHELLRLHKIEKADVRQFFCGGGIVPLSIAFERGDSSRNFLLRSDSSLSVES